MLQVHHKKQKITMALKLGKSYLYISIQAINSTINIKCNELRVIIHFSKNTVLIYKSKQMKQISNGRRIEATIM